MRFTFKNIASRIVAAARRGLGAIARASRMAASYLKQRSHDGFDYWWSWFRSFSEPLYAGASPYAFSPSPSRLYERGAPQRAYRASAFEVNARRTYATPSFTQDHKRGILLATLFAATASIGAATLIVITTAPWALLATAGAGIAVTGFKLTNPRGERGHRSASFGAAAWVATSHLPGAMKDVLIPLTKKMSNIAAWGQQGRTALGNWMQAEWRKISRWNKAIGIAVSAGGLATGFQGAAVMATPVMTPPAAFSDMQQSEALHILKDSGVNYDASVVFSSPQAPTTSTKDRDAPDLSNDADIAAPSSSQAFISPFAPGVGRVTSGYGWRTNPFTGGMENHKGIDLAAPSGTPIHGTLSGTVLYSGVRGGYGNMVEIRVDTPMGPMNEVYGHMERRFVERGDVIQQSDVIGLVGSTGFSTGPHLHLEFDRPGFNWGHKMGTPVNPMRIYTVRSVLAQLNGGPRLG